MKTDDRDERLASILDDAVRTIGDRQPQPPAATIRAIGRAGRVTAAVAAAAVFVAGVVFASGQFGRDTPPTVNADPKPIVSVDVPPAWVQEAAGPGQLAAQVTYPERWILEPARSLGVDTPTQPVFRLGTTRDMLRGVHCGELEVIPGVPTIGIGREPVGPFGALISVASYSDAAWSSTLLGPEFAPRPASISWGDAQDARIYNCSRPAQTATFFVRDGGRWILHVTMGSKVRGSRIGRDLLGVLRRLVLPPDPTAPIAFLPSPGWVSDTTNARYETSTWTSNVELTAGEATFPDPSRLPEGGILVTAFQVGNETPEPDNPNFTRVGLPLDLPEEIETSWEGYKEGLSRSAMFVVVNDRALDIRVYFGTTEPGAALLVQAESALERLLVDPLPTQRDPAEFPPPVDRYRSERVPGQGWRVWPSSAPIREGVVYRFVVPHCGLDWMTDFDGSFWQALYPPGRRPFYSISGDAGTMTLIGPDQARYVASDGSKVGLFRLEGPIVHEGCF